MLIPLRAIAFDHIIHSSCSMAPGMWLLNMLLGWLIGWLVGWPDG